MFEFEHNDQVSNQSESVVTDHMDELVGIKGATEDTLASTAHETEDGSIDINDTCDASATSDGTRESQVGANCVSEDDASACAVDEELTIEDLDEVLFDKANRAARLLRNRRNVLMADAEAEAEKIKDLVRALKLLDLKPRMEQKEMSELLGMPLRKLDAMMAQAEAADIVARIEPNEPDMRKVIVYASDDAVELARAQGQKRKKLVPQLSADDARMLIAQFDKLINPLVAMGLDDDRGPRGGKQGFDARNKRGDHDFGRNTPSGRHVYQDKRKGRDFDRDNRSGRRDGFGGQGRSFGGLGYGGKSRNSGYSERDGRNNRGSYEHTYRNNKFGSGGSGRSPFGPRTREDRRF